MIGLLRRPWCYDRARRLMVPAAASSPAPVPPFDFGAFGGYTLDLDAAHVVLTSGRVSQWPSQVGLMTVDEVSGSGPAPGLIGSVPTVDFNGSSTWLQSPTRPISQLVDANHYSFYLVLQVTAIANVGAYTGNADNDFILGDGAQYFVIGADTQSGGRITATQYAGGYVVKGQSVATGHLVLISARYDGGAPGTPLSLTIDGVGGSIPASGISNVSSLFSVGKSSSSTYFHGKIARILGYNEARSDADDTAIRAALRALYGTA